MRTPRFLRIVIPLAGVLLVAGGAIAITASAAGLKVGSPLAATTTPSPKPSAGTAAGIAGGTAAAACQAYRGHLATQLGVSQAKLDAASAAALKATIQDQVTSGKLTQAQADKIEAKLPTTGLCSAAINGLGRAKAAVATSAYLTAAASALGMTEAQLKADLKGGQNALPGRGRPEGQRGRLQDQGHRLHQDQARCRGRRQGDHPGPGGCAAGEAPGRRSALLELDAQVAPRLRPRPARTALLPVKPRGSPAGRAFRISIRCRDGNQQAFAGSQVLPRLGRLPAAAGDGLHAPRERPPAAAGGAHPLVGRDARQPHHRRAGMVVPLLDEGGWGRVRRARRLGRGRGDGRALRGRDRPRPAS